MKLLTSRTEGFSLNGSHAGTSLPNDPFARVSMSGRATSRTAGRPLPVSRHRRLQRRYDRETWAIPACPRRRSGPYAAPRSPTP